ncbi:unnamed protein product [Caenorhabditis angaria]|uniref:Elongator complex protein 1 n=1 Tax=Caenorhabditis angaria TaxID=860376 RepID=A0A9P1I8X9_9PELO|nr:unnamed protein product [Caenorhabditis angaria]
MKNLKISTVSQQDVPETSQIFDINPITGEIIIATNNHLIFPESGKQIAFENQENLPIILLSVKNEQVLVLLANGSGFGWMEGAEAAEFLEICDICHSERASAEWSPDEQILAISDGNALFFIDPSLTTFYERILSFNDDELHAAPVNVGWGSESTQFRGSAGKLKAGEKIEKERVELEAHSKKSSVCWRFDGEFLGVSYFSEGERTRMLTIFDKNGAVQSSMNIRNIYLSDCFAMRPNANLICSSILKENGMDEVVFFERNGETRNGYLMKWSKNQKSRRIKKISWNSTGSILAFHVICGEEEFLQFWRLSNYEFTQKITWKLEISSNFTFKWSTIDENVIYVLENGKFWNFSIFESSSYSQDLEMNLVVATDEIRISDLCKRAIPPPMFENSLNFEADVVFYRILEKKIHVLTADSVIHQFAQSSNTTNFQKIQTSLLQNPSKGPISGFTYDSEAETYAISKNIDFSEFGAIQVYNVKISKVWLTAEAALYIDGTKIASNIISILPKENDLMVIDFENKLRFVDFENLRFAEDVRDVEAGCELVSADSATANVVLQAARGNLETIQPRRFVIREIKRLLDEKLYIEAFKFMKKHRIDMNFAMDYKKETLSADAETWLQNTCDSQLLEQLIVSCTEQKSDEGNELCTKVYEEILKIEDLKRKTKLFPLLLTSLLRSTPSRINDSLKEIQEFVKDVEDRKDVFTRQSLHHVSFFVPAKELFNCALSTYDLKLAQKVAEASNYDPKEYLPILNRLNKFENELEKQYRINLVRENWVDCLKSLFVLDKYEQSEEKSENWWKEAEEIIERENLYEESLKIANSRDEKRYANCCELYAKYLEKKFLWKEAAMFFELAGDLEKTLKSWEMSRDVDGLISAARRAKLDFAQLKIHAIKMSSALRESRQLKECAKALKLANSPISQIVQVLCEAQEWLLASREVEEKFGESLDKSQEILRNSAISRWETLKLELMRRSAEFERYRARLQIVRENKLKKLEQFAAGEIEDLRDDISMISSISSRSGSSKVSMASTVRRRKQIEKKKNSLKEGGEYEDSALLNVLAENYTWMQQTRGEIAQLLPVLIVSGKMRESLELRDSAEEFTRKLVKSKMSIWPENLAIQMLPGPLYSVLDPNLEPSPVPMPTVFRLEPELIPPNFNFPVIFP